MNIPRVPFDYHHYVQKLDTVLRRLVQGALLCFLCLLCLISLTVYRGLRANGVNQIGYTFDNFNRGARELNEAAKELRLTSTTVNQNSQDELNQAKAAFAAVGGAAGSLGKMVQHTDVMLNGACVIGLPADDAGDRVCIPGVLPTLTDAIGEQRRGLAALETKAGAAIDAQSAAFADLQKRAAAAVDALQPSLQNFAAASLTLSNGLADTLPHITATSAHVESATGHIDGAAGDVQAFIHRETAPVRGTWNIIKSFLQQFAGPAAQVATAAK